MLTVVIETRNDEDALASTLGSLVSAAVEGVVREVLVHDRGSTDRTAAVIDHTGCTLVREGALASSLARARGDWILVLEPGARLLDGWMDAVMEHTGSAGHPVRFSRAANGRAEKLMRLFRRANPLADGVLVMKGDALARLRPEDGVEALARRSPRKRLKAEIRPAAPRRAVR
ncbi:glycosyl transferase family 2 [Nitratireductor mangrovi]|uniref:Glycosyl transferase family 2 n=1 Tax=Nitratireductor mangrovi TaxID=2599600 RepID=A0A5B8KY45_9HYPH|nr:glycosyltransferase [Nitratireductor mangrovi]QDZ00456.1 glycosyl transferase family 2 [Nitratireductor mangrovi]